MSSILRPHLMILETPQNVHKMHFGVIWMTFICDLKIVLIMFELLFNFLFCEPHVKSSCLTLLTSDK